MNVFRAIEKWFRRATLRILSSGSSTERITATDTRPDPRRILLVRVDRIGDAVLSTPVITALRQLYPESTIDVLLGEKNRVIGPHLPDIDNVLVWERHPVRLVRTIARLRGARYQLVVNLHLDRSSNAESASAIANGNMLVEGWRSGWDAGIHAADATFRILRPITDAVPEEPRLIFERRNYIPDRSRIGVNISVRDDRRTLPEEKLRILLNRLSEECGRVVIVAHPDDRERAARLARGPDMDEVEVFLPHDLGTLLYFYRTCRVLITPDSGAVHMAAACRTPVVGLYTSMEKSVRWGPWGVPGRTLYGNGEVATIPVGSVIDETISLMEELTIQNDNDEGVQ